MPPEQQVDQAGIVRTESGEIKDQSKPLDGTPKETPKEEPKAEAKPDGKSILNKDGEAPKGSAPEKYEAFKVPEGFELTEAASTEINTLFKELGLTQEAGQKLVDFYSAKTTEAIDAPYKHYSEMREAWQTEVQQKYGSKLGEVKTTVSKMLDGLGDAKLASSFREAMDLTGAGDHPAFIDVIYNLAKRVTEGSHVKGTGPSKFGQASGAKPASAAAAMYPHLPSAG